MNQDSELKFKESWRLTGELAKEITKEGPGDLEDVKRLARRGRQGRTRQNPTPCLEATKNQLIDGIHFTTHLEAELCEAALADGVFLHGSRSWLLQYALLRPQHPPAVSLALGPPHTSLGHLQVSARRPLS